MLGILTFTIISYPISITLHHGLITLITLYSLYRLFKSRSCVSGTSLLAPINLLNFSTIASTALYMVEKVWTVLSSSFLRYCYVVPFLRRDYDKDFFLKVNSILVLEGILIVPVFLYNLYFRNEMKLLWGNIFKVVEIYSLFLLASLSLALYRRSWFYWWLSLIFLAIILVPARRSETLGLVLTIILIVFVYFRHRREHAKYVVAMLASLLITLAGGFIYMAEVRQDPRFIALVKVIKGEAELNDETMNAISTTRWGNLKNAFIVVKKDLEKGDFLHLLIGHGIYSGQKLDPPPYTPGLPYYESVVFVQELIQRGIIGTLAILFLFYRSIRLLISLDLRREENILLIPFAGFLVFYNLGMLFKPYVNATLPLALLMFGIAEVFLYKSRRT